MRELARIHAHGTPFWGVCLGCAGAGVCALRLDLGIPLGAHLEPVPFLFLVQDRSPPGLVGLSFRTSMPLSVFCSPLSMTSQVGQRPDRSGGPGPGAVLEETETHLSALREGKEEQLCTRDL